MAPIKSPFKHPYDIGTLHINVSNGMGQALKADCVYYSKLMFNF
jgi:hypothetical protein